MSDKFQVTKYRISTITVTGSIFNSDAKCEVILPKLYSVLSNSILDKQLDEISYLEYGSNKQDLQSTGTKQTKLKKKTNAKKKEVTRRRFDNQLTIVMYYNENKYNIKLFKNGNVQITGVKSIDNGSLTIDHLIEIIKNMMLKKEGVGIISNVNDLRNTNYRIRLINSDFKVINCEIRLDYLYNIVTKKYKIICSYEPCIYPGAKIEYYYPNNGFCKCTGFCNGKSDVCKKITIAVFQSGCVIITGANKIEHINVAYEFICKILKDNLENIKRMKLPLPMVSKKK
jgi:TATA-box binding protein (TBP) (component of TFIID and TFIIIB)